jgi:magnesium chelatase subunit I
MEALLKISTIGELEKSGYQSKNIKDELRDNLVKKLQNKEPLFTKVLGYDNTVIPDIERAILARHNINLLGLRGQAKTSIARGLVDLLDAYIPAIEGTELNDDPLNPMSRQALDLIAKHGDKTPIRWMHRSERYTEKLATPDVTVADLIGDVDPIKAANLKLNYNDERVIHFGLVPNANRGIFVINELPDLQPRIQVALFNILQEGDIQIRGFKVRMPLDIQFIFTANPEDYTNRGAIITPLKDRIQSQIITHYPKSIEVSKQITQQEARIKTDQRNRVYVSEFLKDLVEQISFEARQSEFIDQKSGVSARLSISAYENLVSAAERRALTNNEKLATTRISDLYGVIPAITGKVELVYEGEQEGAINVAYNLIGKTIKRFFLQFLPNPETIKRRKDKNPYEPIVNWFANNELQVLFNATEKVYKQELNKVDGLKALAKKYAPLASEDELYTFMEFILHGLVEFSQLSKNALETGFDFKDLLNSVFSSRGGGEEEY